MKLYIACERSAKQDCITKHIYDEYLISLSLSLLSLGRLSSPDTNGTIRFRFQRQHLEKIQAEHE